MSKNIPLCEQEHIHVDVVEMVKGQMLPASEVTGLAGKRGYRALWPV